MATEMIKLEIFVPCSHLEAMREALRSVDENIYLFGFRSSLSVQLGKAFGLDFSKKRLSLAAIKNILATVKT